MGIVHTITLHDTIITTGEMFTALILLLAVAHTAQAGYGPQPVKLIMDTAQAMKTKADGGLLKLEENNVTIEIRKHQQGTFEFTMPNHQIHEVCDTNRLQQLLAHHSQALGLIGPTVDADNKATNTNLKFTVLPAPSIFSSWLFWVLLVVGILCGVCTCYFGYLFYNRKKSDTGEEESVEAMDV